MDDKKLRHLTALAAFAFSLCCLLWVALSHLLLPVSAGQQDYSLMVNNPAWILVALPDLVSTYPEP